MKIKTIQKIKNESKRYDLQTKTGNFFANGMLVHNSLLTAYHDDEDWQVSTRKMAYAEGPTTFGNTFSELFWSVANKKGLKEKLKDLHEYCFIFELTSPQSRVVTPFSVDNITLIGGRSKKGDMPEFSPSALDAFAELFGIDRPKRFTVNGVDDLLKLVSDFPSMEEGVVLLFEHPKGNHWRVKVKNPKFVAIANMRNNGVISPKRILILVMANDHHEYLKYFPEDAKYFNYIEEILSDSQNRIEKIMEKYSSIEDQKEFAQSILKETEYGHESGIIFHVRKAGGSVKQKLLEANPKQLERSFNLKERFKKEFGIESEED